MAFEYRGYTIRLELYEDPTGIADKWHCAIEMRPHTGTHPDRFTAEQCYATAEQAQRGGELVAREYLDKKLAGQAADTLEGKFGAD